MKANEAPDKIYIHVVDDGEEVWHYATCKRENVDDIEYTRTDAFVEKAVEWLENNLQGIVGGSIYIEDFREYLKK